MRHICLVFFLLLSFAPAFGQNDKGRLFISFGYQYTYMYTKLFPSVFCFEGCTPTNQRSIPFPDFNIMYGKKIHSGKWGMLLGVDINTKGWDEEGITEPQNDGTYFGTYHVVIKAKYAGILGGVTYDLFTHRKFRVVVGQLLNPEFRIKWGYYKYRPFAVATRTTVSLQGQIGNSSASFLITPYFFTGLMRYNRRYPDDYPSPHNYTPYGFGLNIGLAFKIRTTPQSIIGAALRGPGSSISGGTWLIKNCFLPVIGQSVPATHPRWLERGVINTFA